MAENDEVTSHNLHGLLKELYPEIDVSVSTMTRVCMDLGWSAKKTRYGAMVSEENIVV